MSILIILTIQKGGSRMREKKIFTSKIFVKTIFTIVVLGGILGGCGKSSSIKGVENEVANEEKIIVDNPSGVIFDDFINEKTYLEIAKFNYMNENMHLLLHKKVSKSSKSLPGGNENRSYPGDIQKLVKQNNLFEISSELMSDNFINRLYIENKSSKISVDVDRDRGVVVVSLFRDGKIIKSEELNFELFADSAVDRYYEED